jgi:hypothetical protein
MLFELRPDAFPGDRLSDLEVVVWGLYLDERAERDRSRRRG